MSKTPSDFKELFGQIHSKMTSKEPEALEIVVTDDFKNIVESLAREFQAVAPGAEGMMAYAKENAFDAQAVSGIWMSIGISAATAGSYQAGWADEVQRLLSNVGGEQGFQQFVNAMIDAYEVANNGVPHPVFSSHKNRYKGNSLANFWDPKFGGENKFSIPTFVRVPVEAIRELRGGAMGIEKPAAVQPKIDIDEIISDMKESPAVKQALQGIAQGLRQELQHRKHRPTDEDQGPGL